MPNTICPSCHTPWSKHLGITGTCLALQRASETITSLKAKYSEAIDDIESWGEYASDYFQDKWKLKEYIAEHRKSLRELG